MGGRVGLKGTDGVAEEARRRGAKPVAPERAQLFLTSLVKETPAATKLRWLTCPAPMGAQTLKHARLPHEVLSMKIGKLTTAADTRAAVQAFVEHHVDLIVFVGGDGTARDVLDALRDANKVLVLGIPAGVKMYSGIFAFSPEAAAGVVASWLEGETQSEAFEVMDVDEQAVRADRLAIRLYGYLHGPLVPARMQGGKALMPDTVDEEENQEAVARTVVESMVPDDWYILGPGSTVRAVANQLGIPKTLLGVDLYKSGRVIQDVNEERLVKEITDFLHAWIVVSPIGNQGILFGRGNQQISPAIIRRIPPEQLIAIATHSKVAGLAERGLHVDTGDPEVDRLLVGYVRVLVDYRTWRMMKVTT
jgi:predicted polyphosphate/ATP-dependent NAD kinase